MTYIGSVNSSAKIMKGEKFGIDTFVVYLAPYKLSGFNTCAKAVIACIMGCLNTSGRVIMDKLNTILNARVARTKLFYADRQAFMQKLIKEIHSASVKSLSKGNRFAIRLNGTSDLSPEIFKYQGKNILELFPHITFYDYSKVLNRTKLVERYPNYDLTFSYSGENWNECEQALKSGVRVAAVFDIKKNQPLPSTWRGYPVIDGDLSDYRPDDPVAIVGLRWKRIRDKKAEQQVKQSSFVIKL